jgi:hypothetical protein
MFGSTRNRWPLVALALVPLSGGCRNPGVTSYADEVAKAAQRLNRPVSSTRVILTDVASSSASSTDDLAKAIVAANDPAPAYERTLSRLLASGVPEEVGKKVLCDTLAEAVLHPDTITAQSIGISLAGNVAGKVGGDAANWALSAHSMASDIADGKASHPLWARVFMLKLKYC